jgi:hypothetical protein
MDCPLDDDMLNPHLARSGGKDTSEHDHVCKLRSDKNAGTEIGEKQTNEKVLPSTDVCVGSSFLMSFSRSQRRNTFWIVE